MDKSTIGFVRKWRNVSRRREKPAIVAFRKLQRHPDPKKAIVALKWVVREMESRYKKMSLLGVRNIENYNQRMIEAINKSEKIIRSIPSVICKTEPSCMLEDPPIVIGSLSPLNTALNQILT